MPDGAKKASLQQRLDSLNAGLPTADQATIVKQATNYVSLAQSLKTKYYEAKKAELQGKLNAITVK